MTALLRSWTSGSGMLLPALLGVFLGIAVVVQAKLTLVALVGLGLAALGVFRPVSLVGLMFLSMLVDRIGVTGMKLGDFPITLSKLSVLGSIGLWVLHVMTHRAPLLRWHPVISALCGVVMATAVGIAIHNCLNIGKFTLYGLGMMTVLVLTVYAVMAEARLQGLYRVLTLALCGALLLSLRGGGGERVAGEVVR
ncbi:MAG TPA: hypothetical protein PKW90_18305, partial [Myxococcota bacterium]|nr:hypothetical protein [Myxococcota bacterium]